MCGIVGVFGREQKSAVEQMLCQIEHRGPDDGYLVYDSYFTLGARRLSIVGIASGRQPLSDESEQIWAAQNGEIYNYPEIKRELLSSQSKLITECDTEVIPHLYKGFGFDFPEHLDGMFAIALWDRLKQKGILVRDRLGKKPLFYMEKDGCLYFASEIKALLAIPGCSRDLNYEALHHYFSFKHVPCPLTIYRGIYSLQPGHCLEYEFGKSIKIRRYWQMSFASSEQGERSEDELVDELIGHLKAGIDRRLMADVPVGFFLSGGLDSSLVTALAAEQSQQPINTFTLVYNSKSTNSGKEQDRYWADWVARKYGTSHKQEVVNYGDFPINLRKIIGAFDEPFCGTISTFFIAPLIRQHVKVAISGDGADELFGSYLSHRLAFPIANYERYIETGDKALLVPFENDIGSLEQYVAPTEAAWRSNLSMFSDTEKDKLYSPRLREALAGIHSARLWQEQFQRASSRDPLNRLLEAEFNTIFPDQVLAFVDRLSMAHSLEVRSPFLDTALVEFVGALPGQLKINRGVTKYLLKKAAERYFPLEMVHRRKEGFVMPITSWLAGDLRFYVQSVLSRKNLDKHQLFDVGVVESLMTAFFDAPEDYRKGNKIFALMVFQEWFEMYMSPCQSLVSSEQMVSSRCLVSTL